MSDNFISAMSGIQNRSARTANGAVTLASTNSAVLDFFSTAGAFRTRSDADIEQTFSRAFSEDKLLALKAAFYLRDCRGGQGERRLFRVIWNWLITNYPELIHRNSLSVPFFGRWDDLFFNEASLRASTPIIRGVVLAYQGGADISYDQLSMFKWMPSVNTSSKETRARAKLMCAGLQMSPKQYRKMLSSAREKLQIVERAMSSGKWESIPFDKVPSRASLLYRKAFWKHTPELYSSYISKVEKGEAKINTSVTYPYEIVREYLEKRSSNDSTLNVIWDNLPDYVQSEEQAIVIADVSGSMQGLPLSVSISLAIYMAERNKDPVFGNHFMTFSNRPALVKLSGNNLFEKIHNLSRAKWDMNTNLQAAFDLILDTAKRANLSADAMPKKLITISDMEFDSACTSRTNFETLRDKYAAAGYELPTLVFWNVNSGIGNQPVAFNETGVMLVSGCSPTIFKNVLSSKMTTPYDLMLEVLNAERYNRVSV